jgi:hypothetical protein
VSCRIMLFNIWNLNFVMQFPIDLDQYDRREQLKKSGLGKVCVFWPRTVINL